MKVMRELAEFASIVKCDTGSSYWTKHGNYEFVAITYKLKDSNIPCIVDIELILCPMNGHMIYINTYGDIDKVRDEGHDWEYDIYHHIIKSLSYVSKIEIIK